MKISTIRTKCLIVLLPLFILSFIAFSAVSYYMSSQALETDADTIAKNISGQAATQVEKELQEKAVRLDELASNPAIIRGSQAERIQALAGMKARTSGFDMVCYADLTGKAVSETGKEMERGTREYFQQVVATKKPFMTGPSVSGTTGKLITILARPVLDNGQLTGIVYGTVSLAFLSDMAGSFQYMTTGYVYIVDQAGLVIGYEQQPDDVGQLDLSKTESSRTLDQRLVDAFQSAISQDRQVSTDYKTSRGVESKAVLTPVHLEGRNWLTVACAPVSEIEAAASSLLHLMILLSVLVVILAIAVVIWFARRISGPIQLIRDECITLNDGDLRQDEVSVEASDEIGELSRGFNQMRQTLRELLKNIQSQSEQVAASSEELTAAAHQSAEASNQVAGSITEIAGGAADQSKAAEGANNVAAGIADHAAGISEETASLAEVTRQAVDHVNEGRQAITDVVTHMDKIDAGTKTIQTAIDELAKGSEQISNIVELIGNIAKQTNLLALNAAVEAARAGEHGRGFAVVAEEVRKLAEESDSSSKRIADLLSKNQLNMDKAIDASREGNDRVAQGMDSVKTADAVFASILTSIQKMANDIERASKEIYKMSESSQSMRQSMASIKDISTRNSDESQTVSAATEEQSASMEEIASASRSLAQLATALQGEVDKFKV